MPVKKTTGRTSDAALIGKLNKRLDKIETQIDGLLSGAAALKKNLTEEADKNSRNINDALNNLAKFMDTKTDAPAPEGFLTKEDVVPVITEVLKTLVVQPGKRSKATNDQLHDVYNKIRYANSDSQDALRAISELL